MARVGNIFVSVCSPESGDSNGCTGFQIGRL